MKAGGCGGLVSVRTLEENCFILGKKSEAAQRESEKNIHLFILLLTKFYMKNLNYMLYGLLFILSDIYDFVIFFEAYGEITYALIRQIYKHIKMYYIYSSNLN